MGFPLASLKVKPFPQKTTAGSASAVMAALLPHRGRHGMAGDGFLGLALSGRSRGRVTPSSGVEGADALRGSPGQSLGRLGHGGCRSFPIAVSSKTQEGKKGRLFLFPFWSVSLDSQGTIFSVFPNFLIKRDSSNKTYFHRKRHLGLFHNTVLDMHSQHRFVRLLYTLLYRLYN